MGAKYKQNKRWSDHWHAGGTVGANSTRYFSGSYLNPVELAASVPAPQNYIIEGFYCRSQLAPGAGETYTYTLMLNGLPQAMTCQTAGAAAVESFDFQNPVAVVIGDLISVRVVTSLNAAVTVHASSLRFRQT